MTYDPTLLLILVLANLTLSFFCTVACIGRWMEWREIRRMLRETPKDSPGETPSASAWRKP